MMEIVDGRMTPAKSQRANAAPQDGLELLLVTRCSHWNGGQCRTRTCDLLLVRQAL